MFQPLNRGLDRNIGVFELSFFYDSPGGYIMVFLWFNFGLGGNIGIFEVSFFYDRGKKSVNQ